MNLQKLLDSKDAEISVKTNAQVYYMNSARDEEEALHRHRIDIIVAEIAYDYREEIKQKILKRIKEEHNE